MIPDKGRVLTALSNFWFERTADIVANHVISCDPTDFPEIAGDVAGRATLVHATRPIRLECVVRGYLFGRGWREYREPGTVGGFAGAGGSAARPSKLPQPLFTPTTKAETGHDDAADGGRSGRARRRRRVRAAARPLAARCTSSAPRTRESAA